MKKKRCLSYEFNKSQINNEIKMRGLRQFCTMYWVSKCLCIALLILDATEVVGLEEYNRRDFPPDFIFGASTSAYQVEGAAFEDGRKPSIFDTFAHSGSIEANGDIASDQYHKYKEDVQLMVKTGLDAYRFSISWSRLIPDGRGAINPKGLEYYNNLINELISHGIQPHITLVHSDIPQALEEEYGGCLSRSFIEDFTAYADVCFREFGDRVLHWITFNEVNVFTFGGYEFGTSPPGRCSSPFGFNCTRGGDSTTEPYVVAHHILLAHASAVTLYKKNYKVKQHGFLGLNLFAYYFIPLTNTTEDKLAVQRSYKFWLGWLMHPLVYGDYPEIMKKNAGNRLPVFTKSEKKLIKGSFDFVGLNYYNAMMVNATRLKAEPRDFKGDLAAELIGFEFSAAIEGDVFPVTSWGLQGVLEYFKQVYDNPPIFIHENGQVTLDVVKVDDQARVDYLQAHVGGLLDALRNGSNTLGYFVWSFVDVYELLFGYKCAFGLYYVDFSDPSRTRYPKLSSLWYSRFLKEEHSFIRGTKQEQDYYKPKMIW